MIFFTDDLGQWEDEEGMPIVPIACVLRTDLAGWYLAEEKRAQVEQRAPNTTIYNITKEDLKPITDIGDVL